MRAVIFRKYGGPENLEQVELPRPVPGPAQVLLRVVNASVNPVDWKMAHGGQRLIMPVCFPMTPGFDVAGEVVELGPGVTEFAVGDRVHARLRKDEGGASAEFTIAGVEVSAKIPAGMDYAQAAGLPLAGMTALQGLRDRCGLPMSGATERVLIVGASGGVGHIAVQIARASGAHVVGVCSGRNAALVSSLGAHEVIDYTKPDAFRDHASFDVVLDCVGGSPTPWLARMPIGGRFASAMPGAAVFLHQFANAVSRKQVRAVLLNANAPDLRALDALVDAGKLRVVVDRRFPLAELRSAWEYSITGRAAGKIVVDVALG